MKNSSIIVGAMVLSISPAFAENRDTPPVQQSQRTMLEWNYRQDLLKLRQQMIAQKVADGGRLTVGDRDAFQADLDNIQLRYKKNLKSFSVYRSNADGSPVDRRNDP